MGTDFRKKYLIETIYAIVEITAKKNGSEITVKKIRQVCGVPPSNRSAINFYSRMLNHLKEEHVLRLLENNSRSPRKYILINKDKLILLIKAENGNAIDNK